MRATAILTAKIPPWLKTVATKFHIVPLVNRRRRLAVSAFLSLSSFKRNTNSVVLQQHSFDKVATFKSVDKEYSLTGGLHTVRPLQILPHLSFCKGLPPLHIRTQKTRFLC